ncbi:MAG: type II secretion system protein [Phycisphaerae bacterium]
MFRRHTHRHNCRALTLVELLVVMSIVALLLAMLLPSLKNARRNARSVVCRAHLRALAGAIHTYAGFNADLVVPSYNMRGVTGSTANPFDGWAPILNRDKYVSGTDDLKQNPFICPDTKDVPGVPFFRTSAKPGHAEGYMDWPAVVTISGSFGRTIPQRGFDTLVRVGYWINGDNPTGLPRNFQQGIHFTGSVGYGPNFSGQIIKANRFSAFKRPAQLIALADGIYAGKQDATRVHNKKRRIGYRHGGSIRTTNVAFADAHVDSVAGDRFPRKPGDNVSIQQARLENTGGGPTLFSDAEKYLPHP